MQAGKVLLTVGASLTAAAALWVFGLVVAATVFGRASTSTLGWVLGALGLYDLVVLIGLGVVSNLVLQRFGLTGSRRAFVVVLVLGIGTMTLALFALITLVVFNR